MFEIVRSTGLESRTYQFKLVYVIVMIFGIIILRMNF